MKKFFIVTGIVIASVALLLSLTVFILNMWATSTVDSTLRRQFATINAHYVAYSDIDIYLGRRLVVLKDFVFSTSLKDTLADTDTGFRVSVKRATIRGVSLYKLFKSGELEIGKVVLEQPEILLQRSKDNLSGEVQKAEQAERTVIARKFLIDLKKFLNKALVLKTEVEDGKFHLRHIDDKMDLAVEDFRITAYDVGYHLKDSTVLYNDSLYMVSLNDFRFLSPDGLFCTEIDNVTTEDAGKIFAGKIHAYHTAKKSSFADRMGKVPVTWADVRLKELQTSPVNVIRQIISGEVNIDSISVKGDKVNIYRDVRYQPKAPYPMPQDKLLSVTMPLYVGNLALKLPQFDVELTTLHLNNCGAMRMRETVATVKNITNKAGEVISVKLNTKLNGGKGDVQMKLKLNKAANLDFAAHITDIQGSSFNNFLHPLFGVKIDCDIRDITTRYSGDRNKLSGDFCMQYKGMKVKVLKDDAPYSAISKSAGAINFFAPMIVPQSNPRVVGKEPVKYTVEHERNVMRNFTTYVIMPMLDGFQQTLLPGFIVKIIKEKQQARQAGASSDTADEKKHGHEQEHKHKSSK